MRRRFEGLREAGLEGVLVSVCLLRPRARLLCRHPPLETRGGWRNPKHLYEKYAPLVGSATAQQVINKNNEAWRSFLKLKKLEKRGKLPKHVRKVSMPKYWKRNGRRELRIIIRNDCYRIDGKYLYLPRGLRLRYWGRLKWRGKRGRLEIIYDDVDGVWRGFMTVKVEEPPRRGGSKPLYIDLGVVNLATIWYEAANSILWQEHLSRLVVLDGEDSQRTKQAG